jgi:hypothetical protein
MTYRRATSRLVALAIVATLLGGGAPLSAQQAASPAALLANRLYVSVGWALGISSQAFTFGESGSGTPSSETDAEPLVNLTGIVGDTAWFALETKAIFGNFGRLVELTGLGDSILTPSADEEGKTSVRRALITDVTFRLSPRWLRGQRLGAELLFNTGFIFDGGGDSGIEATNDAASYWFVGASWNGFFGSGGAFMAADLLFGKSELLTGVEPYADGGPWRIRPRLRFRLPDIKGMSDLDIGFWADLGVDEDTPDAVTVFAAVPIVEIG